MRLTMRDLVGSEVLAGSLNGKAALPHLISAITQGAPEPGPLMLDFDGVEVATGSFLRETVLPARDFSRSIGSNFYPVVANANAAILEELGLVLELRRDAIIVCDIDSAGHVSQWRIVGVLDDRQSATLGLVRELRETDAGELSSRRRGIEEIGQTAWNNRLSNLASMGLLIERIIGRQKKYRTVMERA